MLSIDQEESNTDENKSGMNNQKIVANEAAKLPSIQQKLLEGIEKTKVKFIENFFIIDIIRNKLFFN